MLRYVTIVFPQVKKKLPKVNRALASRIISAEPVDAADEQAQVKKNMPNLLKDERFATLFKDKVSSLVKHGLYVLSFEVRLALLRVSIQLPVSVVRNQLLVVY